jgi:ubiquinone biosynthesis protein UbiJ
MSDTPTRTALKPRPPAQLDLVASSVGEIKALLYKQVVPTLAKLSTSLEGLHNPFVDSPSKGLSQPSSADVHQPQLADLLAALEVVKQRLDNIEERIAKLTPAPTTGAKRGPKPKTETEAEDATPKAG